MASPSLEAPTPKLEPTAEPAAASVTSDASSLWVVALRDVAILAAGLSLFAAADSWHSLGASSISAALSVVDGLLVGFLLTGLIHEWGHFAFARLSGGVAPLRPATAFLPLFDFDYRRNSIDQFRAMSIGGNVAHWLVFFVLLGGLPITTVGQVALLSSAFGFAVFASSIEFPVIWRAYHGATGAEALATIPRDFIRRNGRIGAAAALLAFVIL